MTSLMVAVAVTNGTTAHPSAASTGRSQAATTAAFTDSSRPRQTPGLEGDALIRFRETLQPWTSSIRKKNSDTISATLSEPLSNPQSSLHGASYRTYSQPLRSSRSHGSLAGGRETVPVGVAERTASFG
jgi:hypothetical protein